MVLALEVLRPRYKFAYEKVDIDINDALKERYGLRVPVLVDGRHEICAGHCEPTILEAYFSTTADQ